MEAPETYSKYEKARLTGARSLQIAMGAPFIIKLSTEDLKKINFSPTKIAKMEFNNQLIPMTVVKEDTTKIRRQAEKEKETKAEKNFI